MEMPGAWRPPKPRSNKIKRLNERIGGLDPRTELVIKLPDARLLRVVSRSLFLTLAVLALPSIGLVPISHRSQPPPPAPDAATGPAFLDSVFRDLADRGLLKKGDATLLVASSDDAADGIEIDGGVCVRFRSLYGVAVDVVRDSGLEERLRAVPDQSFDFAFISSFGAPGSVDRVVKIGGIVAVHMSNRSFDAFQKLPYYKIVYLRRFNSVVVGMRKTSAWGEPARLPARWQICRPAAEAKRRALEGLEAALLEPLRRGFNQKQHSGRTKYLPDLLGDGQLRAYPRRVFVNVDSPGAGGGGMEWFQENYPTRSQYFDVYNLKTVAEAATGRAAPPPKWISDWLRESVREDEFVVMKADAEVAEEMLRWKAICLVDELFLECDNQWQAGDGKKKKKKKTTMTTTSSSSTRAYWECLALFGRLRDEGVAVHQWWAAS